MPYDFFGRYVPVKPCDVKYWATCPNCNHHIKLKGNQCWPRCVDIETLCSQCDMLYTRAIEGRGTGHGESVYYTLEDDFDKQFTCPKCLEENKHVKIYYEGVRDCKICAATRGFNHDLVFCKSCGSESTVMGCHFDKEKSIWKYQVKQYNVSNLIYIWPKDHFLHLNGF